MYDAIVLAGGAARRLDGADKPAVHIGAATLLDLVLAATGDAGRVVVVGPRRETDPTSTREVVWCREDPPDGGPVAALAAAVPHTCAGTVLVLAADLPWIGGAVASLLAAVPPDGAAALVDAGGRVNHLAAAWRRTALVAALAALPGVRDASMRALVRGVPSVPVPDTGGWGVDCDTWADVAAARARLGP